MTKLKTCVYAISKNEEKHAERFMEANRDADYVVVCDTGSTDNTVPLLKKLGATVYEIGVNPWRFDLARNTSLSLVPMDVDMCLAIDIDEVLQPGWRDALQKSWDEHNGNIHRLYYTYVWNWNEDGTPGTVFHSDKIHHRKNYRWRHHCHETLYYEGTDPEIKILVPGIDLHHHADITKSRGNYLPLLERGVAEEPQNDRNRYYYARELMFYEQWEKAVEHFQIHLNLPNSTWREERSSSMIYMSRCYTNLNKGDLANEWALKATMEMPSIRETWLALARVGYQNKDWATTYYAAIKCLSIPTRTMSHVGESASWGSEPHDLAALGAWYLGLPDAAKKHGLDALEISPTDPRLRNNCVLMDVGEDTINAVIEASKNKKGA